MKNFVVLVLAAFSLSAIACDGHNKDKSTNPVTPAPAPSERIL
jgi:hypothetical protein